MTSSVIGTAPDVNTPTRTIQFVDLRKQYLPLKEEIIQGFEKTLDGMHLFLGENIQTFEKDFARYCEAEFGIGVSDGTTALKLILLGMGIGQGDEVITVSHSFIATTEAIIQTGATPVFVDIDSKTFLMNPNKIERKITPHTRAIMPVHLYGQTAEMETIRSIAHAHGLRVIEDACQAHGALCDGHRAGSLGDAAGFSFYFSKNLGGFGEGGFITTSDPELAKKIRMLRDHGSEVRYHHDMIGYNARPDELQAVVLRAKLPHLEDWNNARRRNAKLYEHYLAEAPITTPYIARKNIPVYHLYVILTDQRDALQNFLKSKGIFTGIHYPIPIHLQKATAYLGYEVGDLPVTEMIADQILSLPMYPELEEGEIKYIADAILEFFHR